jgi:hypothetical protein
MTSNRRKEEFAARSLNQARTAAEAGNLPLASSELQKLIQTYRGTDAATEAVITLNQVRMVNDQSELAVVGLRDFLGTNPPAEYRAPAYGLLGAALEDSKKFAEPGDVYEGQKTPRWITPRLGTCSMPAGRTVPREDGGRSPFTARWPRSIRARRPAGYGSPS